MNVIELQKMKNSGRKISMVTCYDYSFACIIAQTNIDCVLVGDTSAMIMHGHPTTVHATVDVIALHTQAVVRGSANKFVIADMPFLSYRKGLLQTMRSVEKLMRAGACAIKIERAEGSQATIRHIVDSGVPVMGHLGLTPQSVHQLGGFRVQAKQADAAQKIIDEAKQLQDAGCFAIVLECIPAQVAHTITQQLTIPTIGIGAGAAVDGQVLVLQDLLGMNQNFAPKFLKTYLNGFHLIQSALNQYDAEVKTQQYPTEEHSY